LSSIGAGCKSRPKVNQVERARRLKRAVSAINSKDRKSVRVAGIQIFLHPFSSFPPLNATKKIAHSPTARTRSTTKVCILNTSFGTAFWPANLSAHIGAAAFEESGCHLGSPDTKYDQVQWLGAPFRVLPCHAFQLPKFRNHGSPYGKRKQPRRVCKFTTRCGVDKFLGGLPSLLAELQRHSGVISCINS